MRACQSRERTSAGKQSKTPSREGVEGVEDMGSLAALLSAHLLAGVVEEDIVGEVEYMGFEKEKAGMGDIFFVLRDRMMAGECKVRRRGGELERVLSVNGN